jgi:heptosyltransferase-3
VAVTVSIPVPVRDAGGSDVLAPSRWIDAARWAAIVAASAVMVSPAIANIAMVVMVAALAVSGQAGARLKQACIDPVGAAMLVLIALSALAMLWADVPWRERLDAFWSWRKLWVLPVALALFGPFAWKLRLAIAYVVVCGAAVLLSFGVVAVTGQLPATVFDFAGSMLRNHSAQSIAFATAAFVSLWLAVSSTVARHWRWMAGAFAALFMLNMAFVTSGRSGWVTLATMLVVLAAFAARTRRRAALAIVLSAAVLVALLAAGIAVSPLVRERAAQAGDEWRNAATATEPTSLGIRAVLYENTLELVRERPWLGYGTGGYGPAYQAHVAAKYDDWRRFATVDPHSQYLFFLVEQGVVGLVAFLAFIGIALVSRGDGSRARIVAVGMLLGWCATSLLSSHFKTFAEGHLLAFFVGAMLARPIGAVTPARTGSREKLPRIEPPHRILVVTMRYLGDALLSTPLVRALKRRFPECRIDVLTFAGTEGAFAGNADIAQVCLTPESASLGETLRAAARLWRRYDLAIITQTGTRPFAFGWAAGRRRVGLVSPDPGKSWWKRALLDGYAVFDERGARVLENQRIARLLGIDEPLVVVPPTAGWAHAEVANALDFDPAAVRFAIVHPSPRWRYKQWTAEGWRALIAALVTRGLRVVITGGTDAAERAYLDDVLEGIDMEGVQRVDARWSLAETADVLRWAALYVGPDTATTHLAAAGGTPTLALYGPTDPAIWGPWPARDGAAYARVAATQVRGNVLLVQNPDLACVPCQQEGCDRHRNSHAECLDRLTPARVIAAVDQLLNAAAATGSRRPAEQT